ncbi:TetR family transcriptional regulator [Burkholderia multivorans]|uniref:TetR family transcriptional regulator n=1 Tax=Burkholderia multivorans TaxID=87883 RepID=UPI0018C8812A|nr:TetR family transcriptional regulator [Burkholderia multivorans]MBU9231769.1 TetR family transcriptional regulator [Burkholderia multivorans]HEF4737632.1 TetR family transcriptional regulator [Burkholderia multivorans]
MARWEADARRRLTEAALELFTRQGFAATTTAEIAAAAGLTQRTFFRYFKDKQEVLFGSATVFRERLEQCVVEAPTALSPISAARGALIALSREIEPGRDRLSSRERIIASSPELQEREAAKVRDLSSALSGALTRRGTACSDAELIAQTMLCLFGVAYRQWLKAASKQTLEALFAVNVDDLRQMLNEDVI